jgi:hypothetical protein
VATEYCNYFTCGPSRDVLDLAKAYTSDRTKFSGEDLEHSLRLIRHNFISTCEMIHVSPPEALRAAHVPLMASALDCYYEVIEEESSNYVQVFDMIRDRLQIRTVQEIDFSKWQKLDFSGQRSESDTSDHDTLHTLYLKGKRMHRSMPAS